MIIFALPVLNEEEELKRNCLKLLEYLKKNIHEPWKIVVIDNGSDDNTTEFGAQLAAEYNLISFQHLAQKGRGLALKHVWQKEEADIYCYMDIDLSTDLKHIPAMLQAMKDGYDIAIGNRLMKGAQTQRGLKRDIISRLYNWLIKITFKIKFTDAQCGFKFINKKIKDDVVKKVQDNNWFFDTEMLIKAEKNGYKIYEEPVHWTNDSDSRVKICKTAWQDILGIIRLKLIEKI